MPIVQIPDPAGNIHNIEVDSEGRPVHPLPQAFRVGVQQQAWPSQNRGVRLVTGGHAVVGHGVHQNGHHPGGNNMPVVAGSYPSGGHTRAPAVNVKNGAMRALMNNSGNKETAVANSDTAVMQAEPADGNIMISPLLRKPVPHMKAGVNSFTAGSVSVIEDEDMFASEFKSEFDDDGYADDTSMFDDSEFADDTSFPNETETLINNNTEIHMHASDHMPVEKEKNPLEAAVESEPEANTRKEITQPVASDGFMFQAVSYEHALACVANAMETIQGKLCMVSYLNPLNISHPPEDFHVRMDSIKDLEGAVAHARYLLGQGKDPAPAHLKPLGRYYQKTITDYVNEVLAVYSDGYDASIDDIIEDERDLRGFLINKLGTEERVARLLSSCHGELLRRLPYNTVQMKASSMNEDSRSEYIMESILAVQVLETFLALPYKGRFEMKENKVIELPLELRQQLSEAALVIRAEEPNILHNLAEADSPFSVIYPFDRGVRTMTVITEEQVLRVAIRGETSVGAPKFFLIGTSER